MANTVKKQGDDITLSIKVGSGVSIDDLAELFVYIINSVSKTILIKFSKAGTGDFVALIKVTATNYKAIIPSSITKVTDSKTFDIEGNVVETDAEYEDSEENTITIDDKIILTSSVSKASSSG